MNTSSVDQIVEAVLYEGYILYPYRASSKKNQQRFTFGRVYPKAYSIAECGPESWVMQTQCLARCQDPQGCLQVSARFLQPLWREVGILDKAPPQDSDGRAPGFLSVSQLQVDDQIYQTWQEAMEREARGEPLPLFAAGRAIPKAQYLPFGFAAARTSEQLLDKSGNVAGLQVRRNEALEGLIEVVSEPLDHGLFRITVRILNQTLLMEGQLFDPDAVLMRTFASAHTILRIEGGEFISSMDPPAACKQLVAECKNIGTWPVLVGDEEKGERHTMLSSPIILYDYPKIAPESSGNFFDGTEIDEMLTLRVLTMSEQEKREMRHVDDQARRLLERTQSIDGEQMLKMHGVMRELRTFDEQIFGSNVPLQGVSVQGVYLKKGDRVRIRPKARADMMDMALSGRLAIVEAVEQDAEQRIHLALVVEDDPGKDLGLLRQPGHRFFYGVDEVEPVEGQP